MTENRIFGILLTELTSNKLKLEEELERLLNLNLQTNIKTKKIKKILTKINNIDLNINKLKQYIGTDDRTNEK